VSGRVRYRNSAGLVGGCKLEEEVLLRVRREGKKNPRILKVGILMGLR
jgi:hypothetical protein